MTGHAVVILKSPW